MVSMVIVNYPIGAYQLKNRANVNYLFIFQSITLIGRIVRINAWNLSQDEINYLIISHIDPI